MTGRRRRWAVLRGDRRRESLVGQRFHVDIAACDGYGTCAELVPELIRLDVWGYPIIGDEVIQTQLAAHAHRAVRFCPKLALTVVPADPR